MNADTSTSQRRPAIEQLRSLSVRPFGWLAPLGVLSAGAVLVELLAAVIVTASITRGEPVGDWVSFYAAGTLVREGNGGQLFNSASQAAVQHEVFGRDFVANGYPLPAFVATALSPLTFLSFVQSYWLWFAINAVALGVLGIWGWRELRDVGPQFRALVLGAGALSTPVLYVLVLGQIDLFVAVSLVGCYTLLRRERPFSAGCLLAIGLAKPHLIAAAVLLLVVKREWRALAGFAAVALPLLTAPILMFGPMIVVDQARLLFSYPASSTDHNVAAAMMVNVRGTIVSIAGSSTPWLWLPPLALLGLAAIGFAVRTWTRNGVAARQSWALALVAPLIYSPHAHIQNMVLLVCAAVLYVAARERSGRGETRPEQALLALVLMVSFWLMSVAGLSLLCVFSIGGFAIAARAWPGIPQSEDRIGEASSVVTRRYWDFRRVA